MARARSTAMFLIAVSTMALSVGCQHRWVERQRAAHERAAQQRVAEAEAEILETEAAFNKAGQAKDLEKVMSAYSPDAVMFVPGAPPIHGIEDIRKTWRQLMASPESHLTVTLSALEVARSADQAWQRGTFSLDVVDKKGKTTTQAGEYFLLWKKQNDGAWKIAGDLNAARP